MLECKTYRFRGHSEADPSCGLSYRSQEELASWEKRCPIRRAQKLLSEKGWVTEAELEGMEGRCAQSIQEAVAFAASSPDAPPEWALSDVFTPN